MRNPEDVRDLATTVGLTVWDSFLERACCDKKEVFLNGGWRGGKSAGAAFIVFVAIVHDLLMREGKHLIWLVGPDYSQARQEFFYIQGWATRLGLALDASTAQQGPLTMTLSAPGLPGFIEIATKQAGDPTSLGSVAPVIILACEAGQFSEEAMLWLVGRTAEKNATLIWSGTFENEDGKAQFAWFEEESEKAWTKPNSRQQAFRLPTWENMSLYASCLEMIKDDSSLALWCPSQTEHGTSHSGVNHPMIRKLQDQWKDRPKDWRKRFGGEPVGVREPIYEWSLVDSLTDFTHNKYLRPMPRDLKEAFAQRRVAQYTAGGIDPGLVHPAALTVGSQILAGESEGVTWVRSGVHDLSNTANAMWRAKDYLQKAYGVQKWGGDPVGLQYTREYEDIEAMRGSLFSRMARVKIVNGVAQENMLFFDSDDPYVVLLFAQIQRVHKRKDANGQLVYDRRSDDDMVASFEDMMAMLHGTKVLRVSRRQKLPNYRRREPVTVRSAT